MIISIILALVPYRFYKFRHHTFALWVFCYVLLTLVPGLTSSLLSLVGNTSQFQFHSVRFCNLLRPPTFYRVLVPTPLTSIIHETIFHITKWLLGPISNSLGFSLRKPSSCGLLLHYLLLIVWLWFCLPFLVPENCFLFLIVFYFVFSGNCIERNICMNLVYHVW